MNGEYIAPEYEFVLFSPNDSINTACPCQGCVGDWDDCQTVTASKCSGHCHIVCEDECRNEGCFNVCPDYCILVF